MEVTALCFRLMMVLMVLLDSNVHSQTDGSLFLIVPNRLQFFQYESVSFHCELPDGSSQLRGIRNNNQFVPNCDMRRTLTCNIEPAYDTDSGEYWCETEGGERSSTVNITVTAGPVILESPARPVMEGDDVTLRCRHKTKSINLQAGFYKDGILMKRSSVGEMTINNVSRSDEGLYRCSISGVGDSAESRLTVREPQPSHHRSSDILIPLWISVTLTLVLVLLLLLGLFHFRNHRDAADNLSLCLQTNHSRDPQTEEVKVISDCDWSQVRKRSHEERRAEREERKTLRWIRETRTSLCKHGSELSLS
ncbi:low affinity immunoglobulin gamma Fc region receptor III-A-like [Lates calcarifer]|uniref:low affinity immunoglobulin gamma Fc region receptor III-A-like n=1 Tax=Lates calcarifer TaxID=8187 RepID=UPI0021D7CFBC|nr:low affinity immunoglobulin gamma Fc region receptor III-A-like [Lates calcarifer]